MASMLGTLVLAAVLSQAPPANPTIAPAAGPQPAGAFSSGIRQTVEQRRKTRAARQRARVAQNARQQQLAPALAAQQAQQQELQLRAARLQLQAEQNRALQSMASAEQQRVTIERDRLRIYSQQAGVPQVFVPGQGMVPYPYGMATPFPSMPGPNGYVTPSIPPGASGTTPLAPIGTPLMPLR
jgi:hypothetical protein